ncbi:hypothetical protein IWQ47_004186 [Aquimarina sp. EL_43]|uniref:hypothetical protein n=1 Tax=unclassified Aquimarina TaxID=2627091 RepID=UPI0018C99A9B|nr:MULTISPECIES: hypothetical protein [unclassified Aquimarina]MBG6132950.1 hypothetical protein [Aquimarina sp. EL_35]MBG6152261.1 hypothetical protein [Aquimarina sp. EL_32]MBG6171099.1 hypothetical protein [Aquimarina sp. EL_43]
MRIKTFYILILFLVFTIPVEAQCAMCRAVLENEEGQEAAKGINNGIVYLMIIPYVLIGVVGYIIYRNKRKSATTKNLN